MSNYYVSLQELHFVAACWDCAVDIFTYEPGLDEHARLQLLAAAPVQNLANHIKVILDLGEGNAADRGHYSRLFKESEWSTYNERVVGNDDNPFYSSSSETESASDTDEEEGSDKDGIGSSPKRRGHSDDELSCKPCGPHAFKLLNKKHGSRAESLEDAG